MDGRNLGVEVSVKGFYLGWISIQDLVLGNSAFKVRVKQENIHETEFTFQPSKAFKKAFYIEFLGFILRLSQLEIFITRL